MDILTVDIFSQMARLIGISVCMGRAGESASLQIPKRFYLRLPALTLAVPVFLSSFHFFHSLKFLNYINTFLFKTSNITDNTKSPLDQNSQSQPRRNTFISSCVCLELFLKHLHTNVSEIYFKYVILYVFC